MKYLHDVSTLKLDVNKCTGCGMCTVVCPHSVFKIQDRKTVIRDKDACMECGACQKNCAFGAITLEYGVGCAYAILKAKFFGGQPTCGCDSQNSCC